MISGGAHVGGVVVASGDEKIRGVWSPYTRRWASSGARDDGQRRLRARPACQPEELMDALIAEMSAAHELVEADVDEEPPRWRTACWNGARQAPR